MKFIKVAGILLLAIFVQCSTQTPSSIELGNDKGHLVIIGGGSRPERVMSRFVEFAALHSDGKIVVIPNASGYPLEVGPEQAAEISALTTQDVQSVYLTPETVDSDSIKQLFEGVGGVFFSGGSQNRLTKLLIGTQLLERLRAIYREGGVLGGTSAGAAIMSKIMLNGEEKRYSGEGKLRRIEGDNIVTELGFEFLKGVIIDQHFVKRQRENRLISLVIENPEMIGIGIDEQTAVVRMPDNTLEIIGNSNVLIFDATQAVIPAYDPANYILSAVGMKFHILKEGQVFDLKTVSVVK